MLLRREVGSEQEDEAQVETSTILTQSSSAHFQHSFWILDLSVQLSAVVLAAFRAILRQMSQVKPAQVVARGAQKLRAVEAGVFALLGAELSRRQVKRRRQLEKSRIPD